MCANYVNDDLKSAITNCILCDYIIDELRLAIKRFSKEDLDLFYVHEDFKSAIEKSKNVSFATIGDWESNKIDSYSDCLGIVATIDAMASEQGKIEAGTLIEEFREKTQEYLIQLSSCEMDIDHIDLGTMDVKEEFMKNLLHELTLVDEGQFLSDLGMMQVEMLPLDVHKYRNKFLEGKLRKGESIALSCDRALEREFERLHKDVMSSYDKLYKIAHDALNDGEKTDKARDVVECIPPHRRTLDKLENRLTEANEIKRLITIREKRIKSEMVTRLQEFEKQLEETPYEREGISRQIDAYKFVMEEYLTKIGLVVNAINEVEEEITERYKILDRVEVALRGAIPSENELKRYTSLSFKFEDLYVRLELAKSQVKDKNKDFVTAINTAIRGLGVLINLGYEGKDVFVRNSLLSAVFNSVNGIYDLVDDENKSVELTQIKFVTTRLVQYSQLNNVFMKDLQTFRHICNNVIRDVAIMMGKPFNLKTMLEIIDTIDLAIKQVQEVVDTLNKNQVTETQLLGDILNV